MCRRGEEGSMAGAGLAAGANKGKVGQPMLLRFMGRAKEMTPKTAMIQAMRISIPPHLREYLLKGFMDVDL
jgi:cytochrome c heme-lyase